MTMKKIALAAIAVTAAFAVQASSFSWKVNGSNSAKTFYGADGTSTIAGLTAYLFDVATVSQDSLVTGLRGGGSIADFTSIATSTLDSNSRLTTTAVTYGETGNIYSFYMAIVSGDNVFVSATANATGQASTFANIAFTAIATATKNNLGDAAFSTAGWYSTVPEPTSALLALLGFAGLALRRRRG